MKVTIDSNSGFCFGVKKAIKLAEEVLAKEGELYCLGNIVHNEEEVKRLAKIGLKVIDNKKYKTLSDCKVLIRAHGEPPETYKYADEHGIELIDGSCRVVLNLQDKIKKRNQELKNGNLIIFGKAEHPEVIGLNGTVNYTAHVVKTSTDLNNIDFSLPTALFCQTTMDKKEFYLLKKEIEEKITPPAKFDAHDTICGQVSNRAPGLTEFCNNKDAIVFVGGKHSSNSKVLFDHCKKANPNSFFVTSPKDLDNIPLSSDANVGVCGATSTPFWLMQEVSDKINRTYNS